MKTLQSRALNNRSFFLRFSLSALYACHQHLHQHIDYFSSFRLFSIENALIYFLCYFLIHYLEIRSAIFKSTFRFHWDKEMNLNLRCSRKYLRREHFIVNLNVFRLYFWLRSSDQSKWRAEQEWKSKKERERRREDTKLVNWIQCEMKEIHLK